MKKIKKWNQVGRAVAVLLLTTAILTSCAPKKTESEEQEPLGQSAPLGGAVSESFQEDLGDSDRNERFRKALDDVVDSDSKYYLIACDYDGDGNEEAFAFTGAWNGENENWQELKLYYIHSDGQVEKIEMNDDVVGRPEKIADPEQNDFSDNLITLGDKTFLSFEIGSPSSEYQNVLFGATGNHVTLSYLIGFPEKIDESHIAAEDLDNRIIYREENGIFIEVQRMPGEEYEDQFASREEYLSSMLSEKQLKELAADLGVPEDLEVRYTQGERSYWEAGGCWEIYVKGSLKVFNHRTNVDIQNRLVCYDIKELGNQLKKIGMLVVQDQVWGRVTQNRNAGKSTRYYIDEFHLLLKEEQTATYSIEIWKRFRKWGGIPTGITQNVKDLLRSPEIANILENSDFIYMLNQASEDRTILAQRLNISPHQLSYVTNSGEGEGLLFYGNVILPFVDRFPKDIELYRIMTTKLSEVSKEKEG